jgi:hypothetical protein
MIRRIPENVKIHFLSWLIVQCLLWLTEQVDLIHFYEHGIFFMKPRIYHITKLSHEISLVSSFMLMFSFPFYSFSSFFLFLVPFSPLGWNCCQAHKACMKRIDLKIINKTSLNNRPTVLFLSDCETNRQLNFYILQNEIMFVKSGLNYAKVHIKLSFVKKIKIKDREKI